MIIVPESIPEVERSFEDLGKDILSQESTMYDVDTVVDVVAFAKRCDFTTPVIRDVLDKSIMDALLAVVMKGIPPFSPLDHLQLFAQSKDDGSDVFAMFDYTNTQMTFKLTPLPERSVNEYTKDFLSTLGCSPMSVMEKILTSMNIRQTYQVQYLFELMAYFYHRQKVGDL